MLRLQHVNRMPGVIRGAAHAAWDDAALLPHRRAAAARRVARAVAAPVEGPTVVPRAPGVTDGPWDGQDDKAVAAAIQEAATTAITDTTGYVLLGKTEEELQALAARYNQPKYRAKQLMEGVLQGARTLDDITNVPQAWRAQLKADGVRTGRSVMHHSVAAADGTRKFLLQLADGRVVETVGIPNDESTDGDSGGAVTEQQRVARQEGSRGASSSGRRHQLDVKGRAVGEPRINRHRLTVCVSSQVGCPMRCSFCATGKGGFARNLQPHEIVDQVLTVQEAFGKRVSNVVFMGMGEPLLALPSVVQAYKLLNKQLGIGGRFITISTVGVPNAIVQLAKSDIKSTLAVSIHAPNQEIRQKIIPSAKAYPLSALIKDCATYYKITGRRVTFEYTLLAGINDAPEHARELAELLRSHDLMSHTNVIPWNPVDESEFARPSRNQVYRFIQELEKRGLTATIRATRGLEAAAACGQLRNEHQKNPLPIGERMAA